MRLLIALLILIVAGCGGPRTYPVTGRVTFDGAPVEKGDILFTSPDGYPAGGKITDGVYKAQTRQGVNRVEIRAAREVRKTAQGSEYADYIPDTYNAKSSLTAEVAPGGKNEFDFALTSKK